MKKSRTTAEAVLPITVLPLDLPPDEASFANTIRCKRERRAILGDGTMKKAPEGDDVTMVTAYQETEMLHIEKLLHEAAKMNKVDAVVKILARGINVNCANNLDRTPIQWAAAHGSKDVIKVLLQCNADLESQDKYGMRPSLWAAWYGHGEVLKFLIACGCKPDCTNRQGLNILHCAASQNRVEVIEFILNYLENFNLLVKDKQGRTALHTAANEGHSQTVNKLLSAMKPESLNLKDKCGQTPFLSACSTGGLQCVEMVDALLGNGCDINAKDGSGKTALHLAAEKGHSDVCELILKYPERMQQLDDEKESAECERIRFRLHDDPADKEHEQSALHLCVSGGHTDTVAVLAGNGCNVNVQNAHGDSPLHLAASIGSREAIVQLVKNGAFIDRANCRLQTPLHVAVEKGNIESVKELLDRGANARAQEKTGRTPLYMATRGSFTDIVDLIIEAELKNDTINENNKPVAITNVEPEQNGDTPHDDVVDTELGTVAMVTDDDVIIRDEIQHPHAELIRPILRKLAYKQLGENEWKKLARLFHFSPEHIKAIEHHFEGKLSYKAHAFRMLTIWLHGQGPTSNPTVQLYQGLVRMGRTSLAEEVRTRILLACGEEQTKKKRCLVS